MRTRMPSVDAAGDAALTAASVLAGVPGRVAFNTVDGRHA